MAPEEPIRLDEYNAANNGFTFSFETIGINYANVCEEIYWTTNVGKSNFYFLGCRRLGLKF